ncbi:hypothetical protein PR048_020325 [Dryococelus australis]|uniref:Uncharacterized protein n=1 Tax=Dryococelus australis TaxID=614101 RepID=A0ABQ9H642_9NEOP|nr:hypothetical protein PR048_020325 [Dryococelus australis]
MNHRLELELSYAVDEVSGVNNFQIFMDKLYTLYNNSPKNQRQLAECAAQLDQQVKKIGKVLSTRWVASSFRTKSVVRYSFASLYNHFFASKDDKNRSPIEREMSSGLIRQLSSSEFLMDLAIMYDILAEIALLSESLQNRNMTTILKKNQGQTIYKLELLLREVIFVELPLIKTSRYEPSTHNNFKQRRLFATISSNESEEYDTLLKEVKVLECDQWPSEKPLGFGEIEIERLCRIFKLTASNI